MRSRTMVRGRWMTAGALVATIGLLAACGSSDSSSGGENAPTAGDGPVEGTLTFYTHQPTGNEGKWWDTFIADFERKYPKGTRLVLHGKLAARNAFRVEGHAPTASSTGSDQEVAHYPATVGLSPGGALVQPRRPAALALRRYGAGFSVLLGDVPAGEPVAVRIPPDGTDVPWVLAVTSEAPARVAALAGAAPVAPG